MKDRHCEVEVSHWDALRGGDASSLAWIYDRYYGVLYNYGRKINASANSVEDAIHDLFVDLWRLRNNLSPTTSVRFYLYRALRRRLALDRSAKGLFVDTAFIPENTLNCVPSKEHDLIETEVSEHRVRQLQRSLNNLSPRQYEAMVLRFYDELSFEEIAGILQVNEQSARNLVQRALVQLKQYSRLLLALAVVCITSFPGL